MKDRNYICVRPGQHGPPNADRDHLAGIADIFDRMRSAAIEARHALVCLQRQMPVISGHPEIRRATELLESIELSFPNAAAGPTCRHGALEHALPEYLL